MKHTDTHYEHNAEFSYVKVGRPASAVKWPEFLTTDPEVRVRFPALPDFQKSSEYGTGSAQPCEYN
jgi:hypothetical protein